MSVRRYAIVVVTVIVMRTKYFFGWFLAEGGCLASGFGFNELESTEGDMRWWALHDGLAHVLDLLWASQVADVDVRLSAGIS